MKVHPGNKRTLAMERLGARELLTFSIFPNNPTLTVEEWAKDAVRQNQNQSMGLPVAGTRFNSDAHARDELTNLLVGQFQSLMGKSSTELEGLWNQAFNGQFFALAGYRTASLDHSSEASSLNSVAILPPTTLATNVQTQGVDEADLFEIDGNGLMYVRGTSAISIFDVQDPTNIQPVASIPLDDELDIRMFVFDHQLIVLSQPRSFMFDAFSYRSIYTDIPKAQTSLRVYDVSQPDQPRIVSQAKLDGTVDSAWMVGHQLTLVQKNYKETIQPQFIAADPSQILNWGETPKGRFETEQEFRARVRPIIVESFIDNLSIQNLGADQFESHELGDWNDIHYAGRSSLNYSTTVLSLDIRQDGVQSVESEVIFGPTQIVSYRTGNVLYLASADESNRDTIIQQIAISENDVSLVATGLVQGLVRDSRMLDERDGYLRVFTDVTDPNPSSDLTILEAVDGELQIVSQLRDVADGQSLYSAYFMGEQAFITTWIDNPWSQVTVLPDPLHSFDLSDPTRPLELHELVISGVSTYLQSVGNQQLLGLGYVLVNGQYRMQVSLYDASDLSNLRTVDTWQSAQPVNANFQALNPHAIHIDLTTGLVTLALTDLRLSWSPSQALLVFRIDSNNDEPLKALGQLNDAAGFKRSTVVGNAILAVSDYQVSSYAVDVLPNGSLRELDSQLIVEGIEPSSDPFLLPIVWPTLFDPPILPIVFDQSDETNDDPLDDLIVGIANQRTLLERDRELDARRDVNADGEVTATDILLILNWINDSVSELTNGESAVDLGRLDVSGDSLVTALDAILVINRINEHGSSFVGATASGIISTAEGESTLQTPHDDQLVDFSDGVSSFENRQRRRF